MYARPCNTYCTEEFEDKEGVSLFDVDICPAKPT